MRTTLLVRADPTAEEAVNLARELTAAAHLGLLAIGGMSVRAVQ